MAVPDISAEVAAFRSAAYGEEVREALISLANKLRGVITSELNDMSTTWNNYETDMNSDWDNYKDDIDLEVAKITDLDDDWNRIKQLHSTDDFNDVIRGLYWYANGDIPVNAPDSDLTSAAVVFCFGNTSYYKYQLALVRNDTEKIMLRTKTDNYNFTSWREIKNIDSDLYSDIINILNQEKNDSLNGYEESPHMQHVGFSMPGLSIMDGEGNIGYDLDDFPTSNYTDHSVYPGLSFSDKSGNIVGELSKGKINTLAGKTISFVGDSITTFKDWIPDGYAYFYPKDYLNDVKETWWHQLIAQTGMRLIRNCAWSGSKVSGDSASTTSASAASSDKRVEDVSGPNNETPDFIVILISVNDFNAGVPLGDWSFNKPIPANGTTTTITDAYMLMLYKLHKRYPTSHIFCCTICPHLRSNSDDPPYPTTHPTSGCMETELNQRIRDVARAMNCEIIDFATSGISIWNQSVYMGDSHLHPNALGADIMTNIARSAIEQYNDKITI